MNSKDGAKERKISRFLNRSCIMCENVLNLTKCRL